MIDTHIKARDLAFVLCEGPEKRAGMSFISTNHYSGTCPPGAHLFGAYHQGIMVGAMLIRRPSLPKSRLAYNVDLELSRLVLLDECGRNSESRFIGYAMKRLAALGYKAVLSYADPEQGHLGVIYRAANFVYLGLEKGHGTRRIHVGDEIIHSKTAYDRWGMSGKNLIKLLAPQKVRIVIGERKHAYRYSLQRAERRRQ